MRRAFAVRPPHLDWREALVDVKVVDRAVLRRLVNKPLFRLDPRGGEVPTCEQTNVEANQGAAPLGAAPFATSLTQT